MLPSSKELDNSKRFNFLSFPKVDGMLPVNFFADKFSTCKLSKLPREAGIVSVKLLKRNWTLSNLVSSPNSLGMLPPNGHHTTSKDLSFFKLPIFDDNGPVNGLFVSARCSKFTKLYRPFGKVPENGLLFKLR